MNTRYNSNIWNQTNVQKFYLDTRNLLKTTGEFPDYMQHLLPETLQNFKYICNDMLPLSGKYINSSFPTDKATVPGIRI